MNTQVALDHFDREVDRTEVVHAKFILGSDGEDHRSIPCYIDLTLCC